MFEVKNQTDTLSESFETLNEAIVKAKEYINQTGKIYYVDDTSKEDGDIDKYTFLADI